MRKKKFIAFEGIDGCGKSTQIKFLIQKLKQEGHKVYSTFEPTDSPIGSIIRNIFTHRIEADHRTIAGLFVADRLDHLLNKTNGILKKIEEGYIVITDRYYFSSYAYHSVHMPLEWVIEANRLSAELLRPDLNIYIDIDPEVSIKRISNGRNSMDLYETMENLRSVRDKYFESFEYLRDVEQVYITSGDRKEKEVANDIWNVVSNLLISQYKENDSYL
jgi:dTMP kinase